MNRILTLDNHDYPENYPIHTRLAVRGIAFVNGKLLLVENLQGMIKLPGGGIEPGETDVQTLCREMREETGYVVKTETIEPFGETEEKRLDRCRPSIWHHISRLYRCQVDENPGPCEYTAKEIADGFHTVLYTVEEAIRKHEEMLAQSDDAIKNPREYHVLRMLRDHLNQ